MDDYYETYVKGKTAEQILARPETRSTVYQSYLQVAAQVRSNQELIAELKKASHDSDKTGRKIMWLTFALVATGIIQAVATGWNYLVWFFKHL